MKSLRILAILIAWSGWSITAEGQSSPAIKFQGGNVQITGLAIVAKEKLAALSQEQWGAVLKVYTHEAFAGKIDQAISGSFSWFGDSVSFKPDFKFAAGLQYHAVFDYEALRVMTGKPTGSPHTFELAFAIPGESLGTAYIEAVHPQGDKLPENMLRMYISFTKAMMPGEAYEHINLLREDGTPVEKAFLVIDHELWDSERKRFTLLFDPGRIKRGIQSQTDLGAPLQAGESYRLVIDSLWRDAEGNPLAGSYSKNFTVTAACRSKLNIQSWKVNTVTAGTNQDLLLEFDRPVDHALALKYITVISADGEPVKGQVTFTGSYHWRFAPDKPWTENTYFIETHPLMEDVSGNNFNNAFDIDLSQESRIHTTDVIRLPFQAKSFMK